MYKNRTEDGRNNICGLKIKARRLALTPSVSQRGLADRMQLIGMDMDKNAIQRIECGKRFVTDIELRAFSRVLQVSYVELLEKDCPEGGCV